MSPQARLYFDLSLSTESKVHFIGFSVLSPVLHPLFQHSSIKKTVLSVQTTGTQVLVPSSDLPSSIKLLTHHGRWKRKNVLWIEIYFCPERWIPHCVSWKHYKGLHSECVSFHPHIRVLHKLLTNFMERDVLLNPQSGGPPLVGYLWLLTQYIRSCHNFIIIFVILITVSITTFFSFSSIFVFIIAFFFFFFFHYLDQLNPLLFPNRRILCGESFRYAAGLLERCDHQGIHHHDAVTVEHSCSFGIRLAVSGVWET